MRLIEEFQVHDTLNQKIFDSNNKLKPDVRQKLIEIVQAFEDYLPVPIDIVDVQLVGSNASYNFVESENYNSDIDLHIIANFENISCDPVVLQELYNVKKANFNKDYDITIKGLPVELYVQDIKSTTMSNGIYSVCDDEWIKEPKKLNSVTKHNIEKELTKWTKKIDEVISSKSYEQISNTINMIYLIRHNSLAVDSEYSKGNELFKAIRSAGLLDKLKEAQREAQEKKLSLESYMESFLNI